MVSARIAAGFSSTTAGSTSCTSPITAHVARVTMGASGSVFTARIERAFMQPTQCWVAPLIPHAT